MQIVSHGCQILLCSSNRVTFAVEERFQLAKTKLDSGSNETGERRLMLRRC